MTDTEIIERLVWSGFQVQKDKGDPSRDARGWTNHNGDAPRRLEHPDTGRGSSLYIAPSFVSATGRFRALADEVDPTGHNQRHTKNLNPYWERDAVRHLLDAIEEQHA